jgi:hypothetical protein
LLRLYRRFYVAHPILSSMVMTSPEEFSPVSVSEEKLARQDLVQVQVKKRIIPVPVNARAVCSS